MEHKECTDCYYALKTDKRRKKGCKLMYEPFTDFSCWQDEYLVKQRNQEITEYTGVMFRKSIRKFN